LLERYAAIKLSYSTISIEKNKTEKAQQVAKPVTEAVQKPQEPNLAAVTAKKPAEQVVPQPLPQPTEVNQPLLPPQPRVLLRR
jgi:hypothetical protein